MLYSVSRLQVFKWVVLFGIIVAILHQAALSLYLYWDVFWFDMLMHFLGGVWVTFFGVWLYLFIWKVPPSQRKLFAYGLIFTLIIGILWEIFEIYTGLTFVVSNPVLDTISDLVFDMIGAFIVSTYLAYGKRA